MSRDAPRTSQGTFPNTRPGHGLRRGGGRSTRAAERACVAGHRRRDVDDGLARAEATVLLRRAVIIGELQLERDVRPEKHASVEVPERCVQVALCACQRSFAARSTFSRSFSPQPTSSRAASTMPRRRTRWLRASSLTHDDLPALASFRNTGPGQVPSLLGEAHPWGAVFHALFLAFPVLDRGSWPSEHDRPLRARCPDFAGIEVLDDVGAHH